MRDEETVQKICDALSDYWDVCRKDINQQWRAEHLRSQINVLEWVLENSEAEDIFDDGVIALSGIEEDED